MNPHDSTDLKNENYQKNIICDNKMSKGRIELKGDHHLFSHFEVRICERFLHLNKPEEKIIILSDK